MAVSLVNWVTRSPGGSSLAIEFHRVDLARSRDGAPLNIYNSRSAGRRNLSKALR